jgi:hypothetical protein
MFMLRKCYVGQLTTSCGLPVVQGHLDLQLLFCSIRYGWFDSCRRGVLVMNPLWLGMEITDERSTVAQLVACGRALGFCGSPMGYVWEGISCLYVTRMHTDMMLCKVQYNACHHGATMQDGDDV